MRLSDTDHDRVTAAVTQAETATTGEIVTIVARQSDAYHDVSMHWGVLAMLLTLALLAYHPVAADHIYALVDPWQAAPQGALYVVALVLVTLVFLAVRLVLAWTPARLALTPGATKARRVRRRGERPRCASSPCARTSSGGLVTRSSSSASSSGPAAAACRC